MLRGSEIDSITLINVQRISMDIVMVQLKGTDEEGLGQKLLESFKGDCCCCCCLFIIAEELWKIPSISPGMLLKVAEQANLT